MPLALNSRGSEYVSGSEYTRVPEYTRVTRGSKYAGIYLHKSEIYLIMSEYTIIFVLNIHSIKPSPVVTGL